MACDCIKNWTKVLEEKFNETATIDKSYFTDGTMRVNINGIYHKRKKDGSYAQKWEEVKLYPKYCPFCGKPYDEKEIEESK